MAFRPPAPCVQLPIKETMRFNLFVALAACSTFVLAGDLPSPDLTPGVTNPEVTQESVDNTICVKGWTKTIRPPASYTNKLKKAQLGRYDYPDQNPKHYEEDHLIPLELGGHPTSGANLWPQSWTSQWSAKEKDQLENTLKRLVCAHQLSLQEAQRAIATDWIAAYHTYVAK